MPFFLLDAYAEMLARLQAEEELRTVQATMAGTGTMHRSDHSSYMRRLRERSNPERAFARVKTVQDLALTGMRVVKSTPKKAARG